MALAFYDSTKTLFGSNPLRSTHDAQLGGAYEEKLYIRNADVSKYYTNVELRLHTVAGEGSWSCKFAYGERRPTEAEWDVITAGATLNLPDIGASGAADTSTYHPVWVRIYAPGGEPAQHRKNQFLRLYSFEKAV